MMSEQEPEKVDNYQILDLLPVFVYLQEQDYTIRYGNHNFHQLFGEPGCRPCYEILRGRSEPCETCPTFHVFSEGGVHEWEWMSINGRMYMIRESLFRDTLGTDMVLVSGIDITDLKQAEDDARLNEERFRTVADFTYDWEYWLSTDGELIYNSPSCERITGRPALHFIHSPYLLVDIVHPEDRAAMEKHALDELQTDQVYALDFRILTPDGTERWIAHACQPVFNSDGNPWGRRVSNRDITERKHAEEALLHAERLAAMGRLVASLAHEINNPLQAICNSIELMMNFPLEEEERQSYLRTVWQEIQRLKKVAVEILDFARPKHMRKGPTQIADVLESALSLTEKQLRHNKIQVKLLVPRNLPPIFASPDLLRQVFLNLIINASEQMPNGGILIISVRVLPDHVDIVFEDTGSGIPFDKAKMIFEPFYTTKTDGTGLGLSISQSIISQHNGQLDVHNSPAGGAVFTVSLPTALIGLPEEELQREYRPRKTAAKSKTSHRGR